MPLAAVLLALAWAGRRRGRADASRASATSFLACHVGLVLAAFAGFTLAAALVGVYLWQDRRLKRHAPRLLRVRAPSLATLDTLTGADDRCRAAGA